MEIADWLTKIILGAGLVQLTRLPHSDLEVRETMADGVSGDSGPPMEPPNPADGASNHGIFLHLRSVIRLSLDTI